MRLCWIGSLMLLLFFSIHPQYLSAQSIDFHSTIFSPEGALDNQRVSCMLQDSRGLFWIGTNSGLYMYDGHSISHFQHHANDPNSLVNNNITAILEDERNNIWIGTESGLSCWSRKSRTFTISFVNKRVFDLHLYGEGNILVAAGDNGIIQIDFSQKEVLQTPAFYGLADDYAVMGIEESGNGTFWLATGKGLVRVDKDEMKLSATSVLQPVSVLSVSDNGEYLCGGTASGEVFLIDLKEKPEAVERYSRLDSFRYFIQAITFDDQSRVWVGTTAGLFMQTLEIASAPFKKAGELKGQLLSSDIHSIYIDPNSNIWIGSLMGINCLKELPYSSQIHQVSLNDYRPLNQQIRSLYMDRFGHLWAGMQNDGVFRFNKRMTAVKKIPVPGSKGNDFLETSSGEIFIAINNRLWELDYTGQGQLSQGDFQLRYQGNNTLMTILEPEVGEIWLGSWKEGLRLLKNNTVSLLPIMEELNNKWDNLHVSDLLEDTGGNIWIATRGQGLIKLYPDRVRYDYYDFGANEGDVTYGVLCVAEDRNGNIWAGTRGGGVFLFEPEEDGFRNFTTENGLPFNTVCAITEDINGQIWISTEKGMARYLPGQALPFVSFDNIDVLAGQRFKFNSSATAGGKRLFFGGINGIREIIPAPSPANAESPRAVLCSLAIFDAAENEHVPVPFSPDKRLVLNSRQTSFTLFFSTTDYSLLNAVNYAYRLRGYEEKWKLAGAGSQEAVYHDIPPGEYTFELICSNGNGIWSSLPETYHFAVLRSAWLSAPALFGYIVLICLASFVSVFLIKKRMRRVKNLIHSREEPRLNRATLVRLEPSAVNPDSPDDEFLKKVMQLLEERIEDPMFTMDELIMEVGMSRATFYRKIKELLKDTPSNLIRKFRLERAAQLLKLQKFQVSEIAYMTGFRDPKYFSQCFFREFNCTPSQYTGSLIEQE